MPSKLLAEWRLREIRNIADTLAYRAGCCPISRLLTLAEKRYLIANAHIRLLIQPGLELEKAETYIQQFKGENVDAEYPVDLFEVIIYFNGDLTTKDGWEKTTRELVKQLGWVIFFSPVANDATAASEIKGDPKKEAAFLGDFVDEILKELPFTFDTTRPRFTLAKLRQIVDEELNPKTREVLPPMPKLLRPYLGPDGW